MHVMFSHQTHVSQIMQHNNKNVRRKTEQTQNRTDKLHYTRSPHTAMALVCTTKSPHTATALVCTTKSPHTAMALVCTTKSPHTAMALVCTSKSPHTAMALVCTSKSPHSHGPGLHHQVTTQSHGTGLHHLKVYRFIHELIHYYCISFHKCFYCHISQPGNWVVINRMKNSAISASGKQA